nr:MAG TPA: hypothetical protein [Caudoviricetes sp.]
MKPVNMLTFQAGLAILRMMIRSPVPVLLIVRLNSLILSRQILPKAKKLRLTISKGLMNMEKLHRGT